LAAWEILQNSKKVWLAVLVGGRLASGKAFGAFSSEVDTGSREENASEQKIRARF
jgi:hypothetical protein